MILQYKIKKKFLRNGNHNFLSKRRSKFDGTLIQSSINPSFPFNFTLSYYLGRYSEIIHKMMNIPQSNWKAEGTEFLPKVPLSKLNNETFLIHFNATHKKICIFIKLIPLQITL